MAFGVESAVVSKVTLLYSTCLPSDIYSSTISAEKCCQTFKVNRGSARLEMISE